MPAGCIELLEELQTLLFSLLAIIHALSSNELPVRGFQSPYRGLCDIAWHIYFQESSKPANPRINTRSHICL